jgi:hypothetical protein
MEFVGKCINCYRNRLLQGLFYTDRLDFIAECDAIEKNVVFKGLPGWTQALDGMPNKPNFSLIRMTTMNMLHFGDIDLLLLPLKLKLHLVGMYWHHIFEYLFSA